MRSYLLLCLLCQYSINTAHSQTIRQATFVESNADFPNPERGFYHFRELTKPADLNLRGENITLIFGRISADAFRKEPFTGEFLQKIQDGFDRAREHGIKVIPRVAYNHGGSDPNESVPSSGVSLHLHAR